ncbi:GNAT family N-acetyltransferase [Marinococcus halophilus]|uniref:Lysine N-acyltransferase MbtK n=1 Tax=Marinococcus halophilus TaxID=1371 RepID=A0A510Y5P0_MARHA|nr:GNAT family N-acetyltransferase [Marinococcus halophilus]OZT79824.1 GNAT family N-acetyltransferase [Marinococcus halophilus]GEK58645.1 N-acetyltransferase [Marinococcus halophilus]
MKAQPSNSHIFTREPDGAEGERIQFRAVDEKADFHMLHGWMHETHVVPFWQLNMGESKYRTHLHKALNDPHQTLYIGELDGRPVSYWEVYWAADDIIGSYYRAEPADQGVHLLIGPPEETGKGYALPLLKAMLSVQFQYARTARIIAEPDITNDKMIHVFKKAGFESVKPVDLPDKRGLLMVCRRETFEGGTAGGS